VDLLVGTGPWPVALASVQRWLLPADALPAHSALAAVGPHLRVQGVQGGGVDVADLGSAEGRQDVAVDGAAVVPDGDGGDGADLLAPGEPALDQLTDGAGAAAALLAPVDLLQQLCLDLLGLAVRGPGLAGDLPADPALAAGEGVAAGVDLHLQAAAALPDHPASRADLIFWQKNDKRLPARSKARIGWPLSWGYVVLPTSQHTNLPPLLEGSAVRLASRHAKVRREGYRRRRMC
jgi:hypothetical protein